MSELETFREEVRQWLEANAPQALRGRRNDPAAVPWGGRNPRYAYPESADWLERMAGRGWTAPTWPKEYGGGGLSREHERVLHQELARLELPPGLTGFGLSMIGPTLLQYGTEEQKREHLPKITGGKIRWCQGYSEPDSGSDLASLQTAAVRDGDEFVINGQKIWTSGADLADWIFMLVRTDSSGKKQAGITFILVDMDDPGVEVRPIRLISGASPFCETFFRDVRAPVGNVIGEPGDGWTVAKALLGHERSMIGGMAAPRVSLPELAAEYLGRDEQGRIADPVLRHRVAQSEMDALSFQLTVQRNADSLAAGHQPGPESSMFKYYGTELNMRREQLMLSIRDQQALGWEGDGYSEEELLQTRAWLRSRANSIEGGTSEIQLNIISKRVLGLPG
ncbi:MAG: acyl-CoA dehydrogenase [Acidobacteria bacterium]|nr:MAG: acyl-CoA dehydrogenase [Acidobacteriota bacterium]REK07764.1 MAG: acyl-CoA dehydrogenase [Acidobacteriota bacterium]